SEDAEDRFPGESTRDDRRVRTFGDCLKQLAGLVEVQARIAGKYFRVVAVAEIAQEVRLHARGRKELRVHLGVVKARHCTAIQPQRPRGQNKISTLQASVAKRIGLGQLGRVG